MRWRSTRLYSRLGTVFLALCLVFAALQVSAGHTPPAAQTLSLQAQNHSLHEHGPQPASHCAADCVSTVHYCCVYALCSTPLVSIFRANSTPSSVLTYFFSSRAVTPLTPPPKGRWLLVNYSLI